MCFASEWKVADNEFAPTRNNSVTFACFRRTNFLWVCFWLRFIGCADTFVAVFLFFVLRFWFTIFCLVTFNFVFILLRWVRKTVYPFRYALSVRETKRCKTMSWVYFSRTECACLEPLCCLPKAAGHPSVPIGFDLNASMHSFKKNLPLFIGTNPILAFMDAAALPFGDLAKAHHHGFSRVVPLQVGQVFEFQVPSF